MTKDTLYRPEYDARAKKCCQFGGIDKDLAELFGVTITTIQNWKIHFPSFKEALQAGKDEFDCGKVESALLKRALGFKYKEIRTVLDENGKAIPNQTVVIQKQALPDTGAIIWFQKNRDTKRWRDKPEERTTDNVDRIADFIKGLREETKESDTE